MVRISNNCLPGSFFKPLAFFSYALLGLDWAGLGLRGPHEARLGCPT